MQAFGVLIAEIFLPSKLRGLKPGTPPETAFPSCYEALLCQPPRCATVFASRSWDTAANGEALWDRHTEKYQIARVHSFSNRNPSAMVSLPQTPAGYWTQSSPPFPFPPYFAALHGFIFSYHAKMETTCSLQGRDVVFHLWQQLETLLRGNVTAEGLEILLPFILALMLEESTAVYAAWYLFEPISRVLGPRNAKQVLTEATDQRLWKPSLPARTLLSLHRLFHSAADREASACRPFCPACSPMCCRSSLALKAACQALAGKACKGLRGGTCNLGEEEEEDFQCGEVRQSSGSVSGNMGGGSGAGGGVGVVGETGMVDYSSGISLNDQVFLSEAEDFQNGFYVNSGARCWETAEPELCSQGSRPGVSKRGKAKRQKQHKWALTGRRRLNAGSGQSSNQPTAARTWNTPVRERREESWRKRRWPRLMRVKRAQDDPTAANLGLALSGCTEASGATVATLEGEFVNGMALEETEKGIAGEQEEDDHDPSEESGEKEQKILLGEWVIEVHVHDLVVIW